MKGTNLEVNEDDPEVKKSVVSHGCAVKDIAEATQHGDPRQLMEEKESDRQRTPDWHPLEELIDHHSCWYQLKRAVAWFRRIQYKIRKKESAFDKQLTVQDLEMSEKEIVRHIQRDLRQMIKSAKKGGKCHELSPYVDKEGIVRVGGRIGWLVEWGFYALLASKAIFRARTYNCNLFSPVMMIT